MQTQSMSQPNIQLLLTTETITINASIFEGVLTTKTFKGPDCYVKLIDFLKQSFPCSVMQASIVVT
jgi:hypothetical protein